MIRTRSRLRPAAPMLVALLSACSAFSAREPAGDGRDASLPGSYRVSICRGTCADSLRVSGYLVLATPPANFEGAGSGPGCFSLQRLRGVNGFAWLAPSGQLYWRTAPDDPLRFELYRSPDAGYGVELHAANGRLRGTGRFWEFGYPEEFPTDSVIAERIGPPDERLCALPASTRRPSRPDRFG